MAIFTKFDDLITQVYDMDIGEEENIQVACATLEKKFEMPLRDYKFPPRAYVRFECMSRSPLTTDLGTNSMFSYSRRRR